MPKRNTEAIIISRTLKAAPCLRFVSIYDANNHYVKTCMSEYDNRSIIYLLTVVVHKNKEYCIYVGQSKSQYARFLSHNKNIDFSRIYLFECEKEELSISEQNVISEFKPIYNVDHNPLAKRYKTIFGIDSSLDKTFSNTKRIIKLINNYERVGLFGFAIPPAIFSLLEAKADEKHCTCSEMLQSILETLYPEEISNELKYGSRFIHTNLATTIEYGERHNTRRESIKQFLNANPDRIPGARKLGRDWVLPIDSPYPSDNRKL